MQARAIHNSTTRTHKKVLDACPIDSKRAARHTVSREKQRTPQAQHNAVLIKALRQSRGGRRGACSVHEVRWEPGGGVSTNPAVVRRARSAAAINDEAGRGRNASGTV